MRIAEIFHSIQGEGHLLGVPSVFVRTTGCNLRCVWCDTPYTSWEPVGNSLSLEQIADQVTAYNCRHVVITGGEPLLIAEMESLCTLLFHRGHHITIETAGTIFRAVRCHLMSISPKLSNSTPHQREGGRFALRHDRLRLQPEIFKRLLHLSEYQIKFVIDHPDDIAEVKDLLRLLPDVPPDRVLLMPEGRTREEIAQRGPWLAELCKNTGFRFCPRLHIELFGNRRGT